MDAVKVDVKETKELIAGLVQVATVVVAEVKKAPKISLGLVLVIGQKLITDTVVKEAVVGVSKVISELKDLDAAEAGEVLAGAIEGGVRAYKEIKNTPKAE